jgi:cytoskeleton protein RodZ
MGHEDPEWEVPEQAKHEVAQGRSQKPFTILMVIIIIGLLVNWLMTNGDDEPGIDETVVSELTTVPVDEPVISEPEPPQAEAVSAIELEYSVAEPGLVSETEEVTEPDTSAQMSQPEEVEPEPEAAEPETPIVPPIEEDDRISLTFTADSWVQIFDADGTQTLRGLFRKGDRKEVTGKAPFTVFLGYTPGVALDFNGEPYDASKHTRRDSTSRFTLQAP